MNDCGATVKRTVFCEKMYLNKRGALLKEQRAVLDSSFSYCTNGAG